MQRYCKRGAHIVCVLLAAEFDKAVALVGIRDAVLGQVHIDCSTKETSKLSKGKISALT